MCIPTAYFAPSRGFRHALLSDKLQAALLFGSAVGPGKVWPARRGAARLLHPPGPQEPRSPLGASGTFPRPCAGAVRGSPAATGPGPGPGRPGPPRMPPPPRSALSACRAAAAAASVRVMGRLRGPPPLQEAGRAPGSRRRPGAGRCGTAT